MNLNHKKGMVIVSKHSSSDNYDIKAANTGNWLTFAGTSRQYLTTVHAAFLSGLKNAEHTSKSVRVQQNNLRMCMHKNVRPNNNILVDLFKRHDLESGKFSFILYPSSESQ